MARPRSSGDNTSNNGHIATTQKMRRERGEQISESDEDKRSKEAGEQKQVHPPSMQEVEIAAMSDSTGGDGMSLIIQDRWKMMEESMKGSKWSYMNTTSK